jgi:hypothetical protein
MSNESHRCSEKSSNERNYHQWLNLMEIMKKIPAAEVRGKILRAADSCPGVLTAAGRAASPLSGWCVVRRKLEGANLFTTPQNKAFKLLRCDVVLKIFPNVRFMKAKAGE